MRHGHAPRDAEPSADGISSLARPEILALSPYAHAAWLPSLTRLHANEAPWRPAGDITEAGLNRYPEPQPAGLVVRLAELYEVPADTVLVTRGSDEAIDLLSRIFLREGRDAILQCPPTFGMYQVAARIQGAGVVEVAANAGTWGLDAQRLLAACTPDVKLVYLCSPNNPTGNSLDRGALETICRALDGRAIVVIDEAYIEWSSLPSLTPWLGRYPMLAILRTLSKAHALAGARIGALLAHPKLIRLARRIIAPYALPQSTIEAGLRALAPAALATARGRREDLLVERDALRRGLEASPLVDKVWPSDANFLMIDCHDADRFMQLSMAGGSIVRDLRGNPSLPRALRVSVGTRAENAALLRSLAPQRRAAP